MNLLILGAAGHTGQQLVQQALAAGHEVTAFVRPSHPLGFQAPKLIVTTGDATAVADLTAALKNQDAVITTVSTNKLSSHLVFQATTALIQAMRATGTKRVLLMSSFLLAPNYRPGLMGQLAAALMKGILTDKAAGEAELKNSGLDWTIVYAATLTNGPKTPNYRIVSTDQTVRIHNQISRADVAAFMLSQLTDRKSIGQSLTITAN
jgi:putative NADH-flavin reductase